MQADVDEDLREAPRSAVSFATRFRFSEAHPDEAMAGTGKRDVKETGVFLTLLDGELGGHRILAVAREDRR